MADRSGLGTGGMGWLGWATERMASRRVGRLIAAGDAANRAGDWERAGAAYAEALAIRPDMPDILVQYGHALKEQGLVHRAERAYRRAVRVAPNDADPYLQLGHSLKLLGRRAEAADAYRAALACDPASSSAAQELRDLGAETTTPAETQPKEDEGLALRLAGFDLTPDLLRVFDERFYGEAAGLGPSSSRTDGLDHFGRHGLAKLLPINALDRFDPLFYRDAYLDGRPASGPSAYRHWLNIGLRRGWTANKRRWLDKILGDEVARTDAEASGPILDKEATRPSIATVFDWFFDPAPGAPTDAHADLFGVFAERLVDEGLNRQAAALYRRALGLWPARSEARVGLARALLRLGEIEQAKTIAQDEVDRGASSIAAFDTLADCHETAAEFDLALEVRARAVRALPDSFGLRRRFDDLADRFTHVAWRRAERQARAGDVPGAQASLASTIARISAAVPAAAPLRPKPIRSVAIVANLDLPQCRFYRVDQKVEHLRLAGFGAEVHDFRSETAHFMAQMGRHQAVIFYRVPASYPVILAMRRARDLGLLTIYEIDDLIFDAAEYPPPFESYGGLVGPDEYIGLQLGVPLFAHAMALCDVGLASTPTLAAFMQPLAASGRVWVQRNAFGATHERFAGMARPVRTSDRVTILYGSGTKAHTEDLAVLIEPALVELVRRHGERISIVLIGSVVLTPGLASIESNVTLLETLPVEAYWSVLQTADINLAVLAPSRAADAKSEIKWLEAAMMGVPSVVSATATYREVIDPGVTGFLCDTPDDWLRTLDLLVADPALRERVGAQARERALTAYAPAAASAHLAALLRSIGPGDVRGRPKIVFVNVFYPPQAYGGATRVLHDNVGQLAARYGDAFEVEVFTSIDGAHRPYEVATWAQDGVRVTGITTSPRQGIDLVLDDPAMGAAFGRFLEDARPDLVHFHCIQRLSVAVVEAAQARGIPYVITVHDGWWISSEQFLLDRAMRLQTYDYGDPLRTRRELGQPQYERMQRLRPALLGARRVLAVSQAFAALHTACGVPNVIAIPNGVSGSLRMARTPAGDERLRLGFIGGTDPHKGLWLIREALTARSFTGFSLLVIEHTKKPGQRREAIWGTTRVIFRPPWPQDRVAELYGEIDVLLAPSIWPESFGLVTREALQCGCWVIASDRGSIGEPVSEGVDGFVVDVSGPGALIEVLARIEAGPARYREPPPRAAVPPRTSAQQADDLAVLYETLLGSAASVASETRCAPAIEGGGRPASPAPTGSP